MKNDNVINTDVFDKKKLSNGLSRLLGKLEKHRKEIEKDPWPVLNKAFERITFLERSLKELEEVNNPCPIPLNVGEFDSPSPCRYDIVNVTKEEYQRWLNTDKKLREIIENL